MKIHHDLEQWTTEWLEIRKGRVTGTKLKWVAGWPKAQLTEMYTLLSEKYIVEEEMSARDIILRGHELEPVAKLFYEDFTWYKVEEVGFITKDDLMALSPDWIIQDTVTGKYTRAVEIKCPRGKNFVKYVLEGVVPDEYIYQITQYFLVMDDLEELDMVFFNPDAVNWLEKFHMITVKRADMAEHMAKADDKLIEFKQQLNSLEKKLWTNKNT